LLLPKIKLLLISIIVAAGNLQAQTTARSVAAVRVIIKSDVPQEILPPTFEELPTVLCASDGALPTVPLPTVLRGSA
jgi:hypothetical protein